MLSFLPQGTTVTDAEVDALLKELEKPLPRTSRRSYVPSNQLTKDPLPLPTMPSRGAPAPGERAKYDPGSRNLVSEAAKAIGVELKPRPPALRMKLNHRPLHEIMAERRERMARTENDRKNDELFETLGLSDKAISAEAAEAFLRDGTMPDLKPVVKEPENDSPSPYALTKSGNEADTADVPRDMDDGPPVEEKDNASLLNNPGSEKDTEPQQEDPIDNIVAEKQSQDTHDNENVEGVESNDVQEETSQPVIEQTESHADDEALDDEGDHVPTKMESEDPGKPSANLEAAVEEKSEQPGTMSVDNELPETLKKENESHGIEETPSSPGPELLSETSVTDVTSPTDNAIDKQSVDGEDAEPLQEQPSKDESPDEADNLPQVSEPPENLSSQDAETTEALDGELSEKCLPEGSEETESGAAADTSHRDPVSKSMDQELLQEINSPEAPKEMGANAETHDTDKETIDHLPEPREPHDNQDDEKELDVTESRNVEEQEPNLHTSLPVEEDAQESQTLEELCTDPASQSVDGEAEPTDPPAETLLHETTDQYVTSQDQEMAQDNETNEDGEHLYADQTGTDTRDIEDVTLAPHEDTCADDNAFAKPELDQDQEPSETSQPEDVPDPTNGKSENPTDDGIDTTGGVSSTHVGTDEPQDGSVDPVDKGAQEEESTAHRSDETSTVPDPTLQTEGSKLEHELEESVDEPVPMTKDMEDSELVKNASAQPSVDEAKDVSVSLPTSLRRDDTEDSPSLASNAKEEVEKAGSDNSAIPEMDPSHSSDLPFLADGEPPAELDGPKENLSDDVLHEKDPNLSEEAPVPAASSDPVSAMPQTCHDEFTDVTTVIHPVEGDIDEMKGQTLTDPSSEPAAATFLQNQPDHPNLVDSPDSNDQGADVDTSLRSSDEPLEAGAQSSIHEQASSANTPNNISASKIPPTMLLNTSFARDAMMDPSDSGSVYSNDESAPSSREPKSEGTDPSRVEAASSSLVPMDEMEPATAAPVESNQSCDGDLDEPDDAKGSSKPAPLAEGPASVEEQSRAGLEDASNTNEAGPLSSGQAPSRRIVTAMPPVEPRPMNAKASAAARAVSQPAKPPGHRRTLSDILREADEIIQGSK